METIDTTNFRKNLAASIDKVNDDHEPLLITRVNGRSAVLMAEEDYRAFEEMRHLTSSINNVNAINAGIQSLKEGRYTEIGADDLNDL